MHSKFGEYNPMWSRVWIQNMVTLSHLNQNYIPFTGDGANLVFLLDQDLLDYLQNPQMIGSSENKIESHQEGIIGFLTGAQSIKEKEDQKEVLEFDILEILERDENYTEYLCKPKNVTSSIKKKVKEYAMQKVGLSPKELEIRKGKIQNQYEALNRIKIQNYFQQVEFRFDDENNYFYEITQYEEGMTLREEIDKDTLTFKDKVSIIKNLITALKAAHDESIFHRDITPESVFVHGGVAYLGNFGKAYFMDTPKEGYTVMATLTEANVTAYHAPELLEKDANYATDVYSLGVLIYELFIGRRPIESCFELDKLGGKLPSDRLPSAINGALPRWVDEVCAKTICFDMDDRLNDLTELEEIIEKGEHGLQQEPIKSTSTQILAPQELKIGDNIGIHVIQKVMGQGGYSKVFKVQHSMQGKVYALKLFNQSVNLTSVLDEYEALNNLNHPNIVKFSWNDRFNGQFYTLMEYLEGESLEHYTKENLSLPLAKVYQLADNICSAIIELQKQNPAIFHRDIKPQNIIWDKEERFVLIDFNVASDNQQSKEFVGTSPYIAPDLVTNDMKVNWDLSADTFALGVTLYQMACKVYPWDNNMPSISKLPTEPREHNAELSEAFANFLLKAIQTDKSKRFQSAQEMQEALHAISAEGLRFVEETVEEPIKLTPIEEEETGISENGQLYEKKENKPQDYVHYLNTLFSQSKNGNGGTRANLETSRFDRATYVNTKLDNVLLPSILEGKFKLVIVTGNAGDGKTAFIKNIEENTKASERLQNANGASFSIQGTKYLSNYDGSQDEDEKANDQVLDEFFAPFENMENFGEASEGRIIAINEGRLADFLAHSQKHKKLERVIDQFFSAEGDTELPEGLIIINLNLRSVVASNTERGEKSILRQQIEKITAPNLWTKCKQCNLAKNCFINFNVQSLSDRSTSSEIIARLENLLRTISYRRELHITIRDLRSFVAWMITRDITCEEIEALLDDSVNNATELWEKLYFNISMPADDYVQKDRLIKLIRETDLAANAVPSVDRDLYFVDHKMVNFLAFEDRAMPIIEQFNATKEVVPSFEQTENSRKTARSVHQIFRRHHYFEGKSNFEGRLPYQSLQAFHDLIAGREENGLSEAKEKIARAIALNEGCENEKVYTNHIILSSANIKESCAHAFRRFPLSDFELKHVEQAHLTEYLEYEAEYLLFRHKTEQHITMQISLDLYEMLAFIGQGFSPSLNDLRGKYIELQIFKNLLENLDYAQVILSKDNLSYYKISRQLEGKLRCEPLEL